LNPVLLLKFCPPYFTSKNFNCAFRVESRSPFPLLDLTLFRIPAFTLGNVARFASFVSISTNALLMPFFLQLALGLDPLRAGLLVAPTPLAGWLSERMAPERLCSLGLAI